MKRIFSFQKLCMLMLIAIFASCNPQGEKKTETNDTKKTMNNPLLVGFNEMVDFSKLNAEVINEAAKECIANTKKSLEKIYAIKKEERTFKNTMDAYDDAINKFGTVSNHIYLTGYTHPEKITRESALSNIAKFEKFGNEISLEEKLYNAIKEYSLTKEAKSLDGYKAKFLKENLQDFERNGFALPKAKREELKKLKNKLADLSLTFQKNIAAHKDHLIVEEKDIAGLPDDYKKARKTKDGKYKIGLDYPSYVPFMRYSKSDKARKNLQFKYGNRASDKNLPILKDIIVLRQEMAKLLGFETFAAYKLSDKMAKTPKTVWDFETSLTEKVKAKAKKDYAEVLEVKIKYTKNPKANKINAWESGFYNNILLKDKYKVDGEKVKEYFKTDNVIAGLFKISQHLFDVKFEENKKATVWHKEVKAYNVTKDGKLIGRFYLDLYPRDDKYGHAAMFPMISARQTENGYRLPVASLVCNFPKPTADKPSLLPHGDATTFFHEFGHLLHHLLTTSELSAMSGTSVARDYVETPSQLYENWTLNYDALKLFATHYKTGKVLPKEMFDKMVAAKNVGSGNGTLQQIFYGTLDMTLHYKYDPKGKESTTDLVKRLQNEITLYDYVEGTHFQASFGHLMGYEAGYYSYLWAKVYAEDVFSVFEKNGVMDKKTGEKYLKTMLSRGSSIDEMKQIENFLGRKPSQEAFLKSIGI